MDCLPSEIVIHILSYLPTIDLIHFSTAFEHYSHFLKERRLNEIINFKRMFNLYDFDICGFIITHIDYNYIKVLNIEGLYWITLQDWRTLLPNLNSLEELYALDTNLGLKTKDITLYRSLKKLSLTVEAYHLESVISDEYFNVFYGLKKLFIKLISKKDNFDELYCFLSTLQQLTELWICDDDQTYGINYEKIVCYLPNMNKLVIKSRRPIPLLDFSCWGLMKIFQNARHEFEVENVFERVSLMDIKENRILSPENPVEQSWEIFRSLHVDLPCGLNDFENIIKSCCNVNPTKKVSSIEENPNISNQLESR